MLSRGSHVAVGIENVAELTEPNRNDARLIPPVFGIVCVPDPVRPDAPSKLKLPLGLPRL